MLQHRLQNLAVVLLPETLPTTPIKNGLDEAFLPKKSEVMFGVEVELRPEDSGEQGKVYVPDTSEMIGSATSESLSSSSVRVRASHRGKHGPFRPCEVEMFAQRVASDTPKDCLVRHAAQLVAFS